MKKLFTLLFTLIIVASCLSFSASAVNVGGTYVSETQSAKAKSIQDKFGVNAVFAYFDQDANTSLVDLTEDYIAKNKITGKYTVFALSDDYYYFTWSKELSDTFHSDDSTFVASTLLGKVDKNDLSIETVSEDYYDLIAEMLENRTNCPYKYIKDHAGVLTDEQEKKLNDKLKAYKKEHKADLVIVLTNGIDNGSNTRDDRMDYADDFYDYNDYDKNGALLLVNIGPFDSYSTQNSWISTAGKYINSITEDDISDIGSKLTPLLLDGSYYEAADKFIDLAEGTVKGNIAKQRGFIALITAIVGIIVAFCYTGSLKKQLKSVATATEANHYIVDNSLNITRSYDHFLYANVTRVARESSSSGGGSHTSSSGSSHGGGGF
ncbi:MAG: TPM domain-containing protein [Clostridia bacterium]|nr:TPM domain-containing protein [Clostridia bacterium]